MTLLTGVEAGAVIGQWTADCSGSGHWLALCSGGRGVWWKGRGVFTHRLSIAAADTASERSCSDRNLTLSVEWSSSGGYVASPQVGLHTAGLRSPLVCPPCVWPSPQRPAARWNSPFPEGRPWRDWGHTSPEDWDCRQTELSLCTNTGEFSSYTRTLMSYSAILSWPQTGPWQTADCGEPVGPGCNRWQQTDPHTCHWSWIGCK